MDKYTLSAALSVGPTYAQGDYTQIRDIYSAVDRRPADCEDSCTGDVPE